MQKVKEAKAIFKGQCASTFHNVYTFELLITIKCKKIEMMK